MLSFFGIRILVKNLTLRIKLYRWDVAVKYPSFYGKLYKIPGFSPGALIPRIKDGDICFISTLETRNSQTNRRNRGQCKPRNERSKGKRGGSISKAEEAKGMSREQKAKERAESRESKPRKKSSSSKRTRSG